MTSLVRTPETKPTYSANRETDAHTALTRALKEYLKPIQFTDASGTVVTFKQAFDTWTEPEDVAEYPSLVVYSPERGPYDASNFVPVDGERSQVGTGITLMKGSELELMLHVDIYTSDPESRVALMMAVEDAFLPVDWMYGARLALPHYFGVQCDFALEAGTYVDDAQKAQDRVRIAHLEVSTTISVMRVVEYQENRTKLATTVSRDPPEVVRHR